MTDAAVTLDQGELDELRRLCDAATPGEWFASPVTRRSEVRVRAPHYTGMGEVLARHLSHEDARFIAAARSALPHLLADNEAKAREITELRKLGNLSNALWVEAEKEIESLVEPVEYQDYLCFTRGTVRRMEQEKADLEAEFARLKARPTTEDTTPTARWRVAGEADPHGNRYDCDRHELIGGTLTDDEVANAVFLDPCHPNLEIAKDRIRWLSRRLAAQSDGWRPIEEEGGQHSPAVCRAMAHFWTKMAERREVEEAAPPSPSTEEK